MAEKSALGFFNEEADKKGHFGLYVLGVLVLLAGLVALIVIAGFFAGVGVFADMMSLLSVYGYSMTALGGVVGVVMAVFFLLLGYSLLKEKKWAYWLYHIFVIFAFFGAIYGMWVGDWMVGLGGFIITALLLFYLRWIAKDISSEACKDGTVTKVLACSAIRKD